MIQLRSNCLVCETEEGDHIPFSADTLTEELVEQLGTAIEPEIVRAAAESVVQYYREDQSIDMVRLSDFVEAITQALQSLGFEIAIDVDPTTGARPTNVSESYLGDWVSEPGCFAELTFFPRLRESLRVLFESNPEMVRITGVKSCVKSMANARRWSRRCQVLHDQVVLYLHACWLQERNPACGQIVIQ